MDVSALFNTRQHVPATGGATAAADATTTVTTPAFLTKESLASFPLASGLVMGLAGLARSAGIETPRPWPEIVLGLVVAAIVAWASMSDRTLTLAPAEKRVAWAIAMLNGLYLAMAAYGAASLGDPALRIPATPPVTHSPASPGPVR